MDENLPIFEDDEAEVLDKSIEAVPADEIVVMVKDAFKRAEDKRITDESRWLRAYKNFRGKYDGETSFSEAEKSRIFVKVTKTKVLAAYGQIVEVLFGNGKFPLTIDNTKLPEGVAEDVSFDPQAPPSTPKPPAAPVSPFGVNNGPALPPGATANSLMSLGPLEEKLAPVRDKLVPGPGTTATAVTFHPAYVAAKKMEKKIHDQLEESNANKHLRTSAFEMALFGTGVLKGPFAVDKEYPNWGEDGSYTPTMKTVPYCDSVSIWNFYPDPDSANMDESEFVVERHKLSRTNLVALKDRPYFREDAIDEIIDNGPNYIRKYWEDTIEESNHSSSIERWEVLEYWGFCPVECLRDRDIPVPKEYKDKDQVNVNIWVCGDQVLRLVMNPFKPVRIPYYAAPFELNPYSFFGLGIADNMDDTQILMNGFMRMAVDNAALSGSIVFEVDEDNLSPGQDFEIYPGKVFRRRGGAPGQAIFATEFPNVAQQNMMLFDKARVLADESTGLPSYSYGQTGVQGVGRTASGISMLMNAANGSIRTVVKNLDDYLIGPFGKAYFAFNMQFDHDPSIKGDLEVNARGTESLMASEVKSQRLMQFLGTVSNPLLAPFAKLDVIVREIAKSLDLDPDKVTNSLPDAAIQAELLKQMQAVPDVGGGQAPTAPPAGVTTESGPNSGGGTISSGSAPAPGTAGFSANTGEGTQ